mgnify:CR=1 FL=1
MFYTYVNMSGGALDYLFTKISYYKEDIEKFLNERIKEEEISEKTKNKILNFLEEIKEFLWALEWWMSADISYEEFEKYVKEKVRAWESI